jgi:nucleotide-binding universal stress UspA family protein
MRIIVPIVRSVEGQLALALAEEEAIFRKAELILVGTALVGHSVSDDVEALRAHASELEQRFRENGVACRSEWSVGLSASRAIVEAAIQHEASLIVLGLRRRSAVGKALLGSYEQEVLLDAPCPVLCVKAPLRG